MTAHPATFRVLFAVSFGLVSLDPAEPLEILGFASCESYSKVLRSWWLLAHKLLGSFNDMSRTFWLVDCVSSASMKPPGIALCFFLQLKQTMNFKGVSLPKAAQMSLAILISLSTVHLPLLPHDCPLHSTNHHLAKIFQVFRPYLESERISFFAG